MECAVALHARPEAYFLAMLIAGCNSSVETAPPAPPSGPASCGEPSRCGTADESCCASPTVEGGTSNLLDEPAWPATVSSFRLDKFEVTVARLRAFVEAYPASRPKVGAGAHPKLPWSGWRAAWDSELPSTQAELRKALATLPPPTVPPDSVDQTPFIAWSDKPGNHEQVAGSIVSWYVAYAFCAWDGGRLPTNAEWNYAAVGGAEQRAYPWGASTPDATRAVLHLVPSDAYDVFAPVGSKPAGVGKYGQLDLGGNRFEWVLDAYDPSQSLKDVLGPCEDCAVQDSGASIWRVARNQCYAQDATSSVAKVELEYPPDRADTSIGLRCARDLP